jgi:hypothetical protein
MRQIDWDAELSADDKAWVRQAGLLRAEERIAENEARFGAGRSIDDVKVPPDPSRSAMDPTATASDGPVPTANATPENPADEGADDEDAKDDGDDYDRWTVEELNDEMNDRNTDPERTKDAIAVTGTGRNGKVLKADVIAALRADDNA